MTDPIRKPIKGWEGYYEVDNMGNVYSLDRVITVNDHGRIYQKPIKGKATKGTKCDRGYLKVMLCRQDARREVYVHRLVAETFIPNPNGYDVVNHINENKSDNRAENLEWCTLQYNVTYGAARERWASKVRGKKRTPEQKERQRAAIKEYYRTHPSATLGRSSEKRKPVIARRVNDTEWIEFASETHAGKALGIKQQSIGRVCNGKLRTTHGYVFKFKGEEDGETI